MAGTFNPWDDRVPRECVPKWVLTPDNITRSLFARLRNRGLVR